MLAGTVPDEEEFLAKRIKRNLGAYVVQAAAERINAAKLPRALREVFEGSRLGRR